MNLINAIAGNLHTIILMGDQQLAKDYIAASLQPNEKLILQKMVQLVQVNK